MHKVLKIGLIVAYRGLRTNGYTHPSEIVKYISCWIEITVKTLQYRTNPGSSEGMAHPYHGHGILRQPGIPPTVVALRVPELLHSPLQNNPLHCHLLGGFAIILFKCSNSLGIVFMQDRIVTVILGVEEIQHPLHVDKDRSGKHLLISLCELKTMKYGDDADKTYKILRLPAFLLLLTAF
jgi:hypothetical protein